MIGRNLPETALRQLEGCKSEWNIENLRKHLKEYVKACEKASKKKDDHEVSKQNIHSQANPRLVPVSTKVKPLLQVPVSQPNLSSK